MIVAAWLAFLVCLLRAEHVWASNYWIAVSGQRFKDMEVELRKEKRRALRDINGKKNAPSWKSIGLTPEERWRLYQDTGGGDLPWLFFGIRSHRLLVTARSKTGVARGALHALRICWLNWAFPVILSATLLALAVQETPRIADIGLIAAAVALGLNTIGTAVGGVFSAMTMSGLSRHHDSWSMDEDARARAIAEFAYMLVACALVLLSLSVFIAITAVKFSPGMGNEDLGWVDLLLSSVAPIGNDSLAFSGTPELIVGVVTRVCLFVVGIAMSFATASTARIWRHR